MSDSFIHQNGGLSVHIPADEVNWFDFLGFSRATNSLRGGWNSKSHWRTRGVNVFVDANSAEFLAEWTRQSLASDCVHLPEPRSGGFMFDREHSESRTRLEATFLDRKSLLDEATENELSYALFKGGCGKLQPLSGIKLIGYEVPLCADSEGQLKVDLFGLSEGDEAIEILELKKAKNHSDSPLIALTEAICYGLQVLRCKRHLLACEELKGHAQAFSHVRLTVLAPEGYWRYWSERGDAESVMKACNETFSQLIRGVNAGIAPVYGGARLSASAQVLSTQSET